MNYQTNLSIVRFSLNLNLNLKDQDKYLSSELILFFIYLWIFRIKKSNQSKHLCIFIFFEIIHLQILIENSRSYQRLAKYS